MARTIRRKSFRWYRRPRTTQERRENHVYTVDAKEIGISISNREKARGNPNNIKIPEAWDDITVKGNFEKRAVFKVGKEIKRLNQNSK